MPKYTDEEGESVYDDVDAAGDVKSHKLLENTDCLVACKDNRVGDSGKYQRGRGDSGKPYSYSFGCQELYSVGGQMWSSGSVHRDTTDESRW